MTFFVKSISRNFREIDFTKKLLLISSRNLTIKEQVDMIMSQLHSKQQKRVENVKAEMISGSRTVNNSAPKSTVSSSHITFRYSLILRAIILKIIYLCHYLSLSKLHMGWPLATQLAKRALRDKLWKNKNFSK